MTETCQTYAYGQIVKLDNQLTARVLLDEPGRPTVLCIIVISGWGDPIREIPRERIITLLQEQDQ